MKKNKLSILLILLLVLSQLTCLYQVNAKAAEKAISATVVVESFDKVLTVDTTDENNGMKAVISVLNSHGISHKEKAPSWDPNSSYIYEVNGIAEKHFNGGDGWLYAVKRGGKYVDITTGLDQFNLIEGDELIFYYGDWSSTLVANKIELSTTKENSPLTINISNYNAWNNPDTTLINDVKAKLDNQPVEVKGNQISLPMGLAFGKHILELSDFKTDTVPKIMADNFEINIDDSSPSGGGDTNITDIYNRDNTKIVKDLNTELTATTNYLVHSSQDPWAQLSLEKLELKTDDGYIKDSAIDIRKNGIKDYSNTDLEKLIMCLTAKGFSPYNFMNYNLVSELLDRDINTFLINDAAYALLTYNYANVSGSYNLTRDKLIAYILSSKINYKNGVKNITGWALSGTRINPDITGLVITALAPYSGKSEVKEAIDGAVNGLESLQNDSGYLLAESFGYSSESISVVILGLISNGIDPEGSGFSKSKGDLVSALLSFKGSNGQFKHTIDGTNDSIATEEALRALIALKEYKNSGRYDYYSSSISSEKLSPYKLTELPQTGAKVDFSVIIIFGFILITTGSVVCFKRSLSI